MADLSQATSLIGLLIRFFPEIREALASLFGGGADTAAAIARIEAMKSPEEIEADVDAGLLPEPWKSRRQLVAFEKGLGDVAYALIQAQVLGGINDVDPADAAAAEAAHQGLVEAYGQCIAAIGALQEGAYNVASERLTANLGTLLELKLKICPFINPKDED